MVAVVMMMVVCDHAAIHVSSGKRGPGECDCGESRDEFDLVHGMVPFVVRASPFSRLHKGRTIRRKFLTKDFETDNRSDESAARDHELGSLRQLRTPSECYKGGPSLRDGPCEATIT